MNTKICCTCKLPKAFEEFAKNCRVKDGLNARCRVCAKVYKDKWNELNNQKIKEYYQTKKADPAWQASQKEKRHSKYLIDRDKLLLRNRLRRRTEKAKIKQRANEKLRRLTNPTYRLRTTLNNRLRRMLKGKGGTKTTSIINLLGCSLPEFIKHLESTWQTDMSWDNYGSCAKCWQIDHIKPCASFDLTDPEQLKACYHYLNCQALWRLDNLTKGDRLDFKLDNLATL